MNMKVSILGGSGFVGSSLINILEKEKMDYLVLDKKSTDKNFCFADVTKPETLDVVDDSDLIINLAAVHRDDIKPISLYDEINVEGAKNICNLADKKNIKKIIFTSSVAVYGFTPGDTSEDGEFNFYNDYGRTKYLAEQIFKKWQLSDPKNKSLVIIRPTVIFGEGNRGNVFNLLNQIASKKFIMFGSGKNLKSMAYVENVAGFIRYCFKYDSGIHIYNYVDKPDLSMKELVGFTRKFLFNKQTLGLRFPKFLGLFAGLIFDVISFFLNKNLSISRIRVRKFFSNSQFSSSVSKTSYKAKFSLLDGLERTLEYEFLKNNKDKKVFLTE
tara:strand:+ start:2240 stop:3223 length:984 start_codon:yes stop_codon:yes gene_type:complete